MTYVPPEQGADPQQGAYPQGTSTPAQQAQFDPSGQWEWNQVQQQWVPAHGAQSEPGRHGAQAEPAPQAQDQPLTSGYAPTQSYPPGQGYGAPAAATQGAAAYPPAGAAYAPAVPAAQGYAPPPPGYAPPPSGYGPAGGYPAPGGPGGGKPKSNRTVFIAVAVVAVVVAAAVIGFVAFGGSSSKSSASPSGTVTNYLNDLAKGDAGGALAQGVNPPSTTFLTSDILKLQQTKDKISNIKIGQTQTSGNRSQVHATYQFGPRSSDETYQLTKTGGKWKLTDTTFQIDVSGLTDIPQLTLFDKPVANLSKVYVFPGPLTWGSQNKYFTVTEKDADKFAVSPYDTSAIFTELTPALSDDGRQAVQTAITTGFAKCAESKSLTPDNCPQREYGDTDTTGIPKDGTVKWTAPTDLSGLKYNSFGSATKLDVSGTTTWKATYQSESFSTNAISTITDPSAKGLVFGTVDLSQTPPVFTQN